MPTSTNLAKLSRTTRLHPLISVAAPKARRTSPIGNPIASSPRRAGVAAIGVAQEFQRVWTAYGRPPTPGRASSASPRPTGG